MGGLWSTDMSADPVVESGARFLEGGWNGQLLEQFHLLREPNNENIKLAIC